MGTSLAINLANLSLKEIAFGLRPAGPTGVGIQPADDKNVLCPCCNRKETYRSKGLSRRDAETGTILEARKYAIMYAHH